MGAPAPITSCSVFGDPSFYTNSNGVAAVPPSIRVENPNPQASTNNFYDQDATAAQLCQLRRYRPAWCPAVTNYLQSLKRPVNPNCVKGNYYLVNNYNPGYNATHAYFADSPSRSLPRTKRASVTISSLTTSLSSTSAKTGILCYRSYGVEQLSMSIATFATLFQYQTQFMELKLLVRPISQTQRSSNEDIDPGTCLQSPSSKPKRYERWSSCVIQTRSL